MPKISIGNSTNQLNFNQQHLRPAVVSSNNLINQGPPPPYQKRVPTERVRKLIPPPPTHPPPQRPASIPTRNSQIRSRAEEYRNRNLSDSELSDSERHQQRRRSRSSQPRQLIGISGGNNFVHVNRRSNEIFLGKLAN